MSTPEVVKLLRGSAAIALTGGHYSVALDFIPPTVKRQALMAGGTSANRLAGSAKIGETDLNLSWSFSVNLNGASEADVRQAAAALENFLLGAGDDNNPTYLYLKGHSDTAQDPLWGQAAYYYTIQMADVGLPNSWPSGDMRAKWLGNCPVTTQIKPFALGVPQTLAQASGGVLPDQWGPWMAPSAGCKCPRRRST